MGIIHFFLIVIVIGLLVYLIRRFVPMDEVFKSVVLWAGVAVVVLLLLYALGVLPMGDVAIPRVR